MSKQLLNIGIVFIVLETIYTLLNWFNEFLDPYFSSYYVFVDDYRFWVNLAFSTGMVIILYFYFRAVDFFLPWFIYLAVKAAGIMSYLMWLGLTEESTLLLNLTDFFGVLITLGWGVFYAFVAFGRVKHWALMLMGIFGLISVGIPLLVYDIFKLYDLIEGLYYIGILAAFGSLLWIPAFISAQSDEEFLEDEFGQYRKE